MSPLSANSVQTTNPRHSAKSYINIDHIVSYTLNAAYHAMHGWLSGRPLDEIALLNRLTDKLINNPCIEFPRYARNEISRNLFVLHHRGLYGVDAFGADLAVTVNIFAKGSKIDDNLSQSLFSKTALLQLKRGQKFTPSLERRQLEQPLHFAGHSFVLYADQDTAEYRVDGTNDVLSQFPPKPILKTKTINGIIQEIKEQSYPISAHGWMSLAEWLVEWLTCQVGVFSDDPQRRAIEQVLSRYSIDEEKKIDPRGRFAPNKSAKKTPSAAPDVPVDLDVSNQSVSAWLVFDIYVDSPLFS